MALLTKHEWEYIIENSAGVSRKVDSLCGPDWAWGAVVDLKFERVVVIDFPNPLVEPNWIMGRLCMSNIELLAKHEVKYIRENTYNSLDPKMFGWKHKIEYHSMADFVFVESYGREDTLFEKTTDFGWTFH